MNSQEELAEAFEHYRAGKDGAAGRCSRSTYSELPKTI